MNIHIAVVGATGIVGHTFFEILSESSLKFSKIDALASAASLGTSITFGEGELKIKTLEDYDFKGVDIVVFATSDLVSQTYVPKALKAGCCVVDKSSFYRMDENTPLIVPEINGDLIDIQKHKLFANPNCMTTGIVMALKPLLDLSDIKRMVVTTYQSVSGAGKSAMDELFQQTRGVFIGSEKESHCFPKQIAFNLIPQIDSFISDGRTEEEVKIQEETLKILGEVFSISVTCVRVPVFIGHCASLNIEFAEEVGVHEARSVFKKFPNLLVVDQREEGGYVTPQEIAGENEVFVSRIRKDDSRENTLNLWIAFDNLRKGAAYNAFQIVEKIYEQLKQKA